MKKIFILILALLSFRSTFANHIAGGELFYEYIGPGSAANSSRYKLTMRLFRDCYSNGQTLETEAVVVGIYRTGNLSMHTKTTLALQTPVRSIALNTGAIPCLTGAPEVCFQIGIFTATVDLPTSPDGYTLSWIRCCRPDFISNIGIMSNIGATFSTTIPGTSKIPVGNNSSPQFAIKDTALVCQNKSFTLDFGAFDADGDSLSYSFCEAFSGGSSTRPNPGSEPGGLPQTLPLNSLPYKSPFSGENPLGKDVVINSRTGKITGKAPAAGRYVINVCVTEWRKGVAINVHRKDFILLIGNCDFATAEPIPLSGAYCKDFKVNFSNNSTSSSINSYYWDFGVPNSTSDTSTLPEPIFEYQDTGTYTIKLTVSGEKGCTDTGSATLGVYPGFKPDFDVVGSCFQSPFKFADKTVAAYGEVNSWSWDFGDDATTTDISSAKNPSYKYPGTGTRTALLTVTSTKGCIDTVSKQVVVRDVPFLSLPFKDTLICSIDTLPLQALGTGNFTWTPAYNIIDPNTSQPFVYPKDTTTYVVTLNENGCTAVDSIKVNVLNSISVFAGADTSICLTDTVRLNPVSHGLQYQWTPAGEIAGDPNIKNAVARPQGTTTYQVVANLGNCQARDNITIRTVPYPQADAGSDAIICFGKQTHLAGSIVGSSFTWTPQNSLLNPATLTPVAGPISTTRYVLTVRDTIGCPKPFSDTVVVNVVPEVKAFAGNDTSIVANQPLQLNATGGTAYAWSPLIGIDNPSIANPVVLLNASYDSVIYKVRVSVPEGCFAEDELKVLVFKTGPDIFVPTAFTPNRDGKNDVLRPIAVGIRSINYFKVFNRWGQVVYASSMIQDGWDGTFGGKDQPTGTYVFAAEGTDYLNKPILKKGTVVLIR